MVSMMEPPIDEIKAKTGDNPYVLCRVVSNLAKKLENEIPAEIEKSDRKAISIAAEMINDGKFVPSDMAVGVANITGIKPNKN